MVCWVCKVSAHTCFKAVGSNLTLCLLCGCGDCFFIIIFDRLNGAVGVWNREVRKSLDGGARYSLKI